MQLVPRPLRRSQNHSHRIVTNGYKCVLINSTAFVDWADLSESVFAFSFSRFSNFSVFVKIYETALRRSRQMLPGMTSMLMLMLFRKKYSSPSWELELRPPRGRYGERPQRDSV